MRLFFRNNLPFPFRPWPWLTMLAGLLLAVTALVAAALSENHAAASVPGQSQPAECANLVIDQDDDYTPGARVDLELTFTDADGDRNCVPGRPTDEITIELPEELNLPARYDRDDIVLRAGPRYLPNWMDYDPGDGGPHEIGLPSCHEWELYGARADCAEVNLTAFHITLNDLRLPPYPPPEDETYTVSVQWDSGEKLSRALRVDPTLVIDDDEFDEDETVNYGQTVAFTGIGFTRGVTANLYANQDNGSSNCKDVSGWREIGSAVVGSDYRFTADVPIDTSNFRRAGRYQLCVRDGAARSLARSISVTVAAGLIISGSGSVSPGEEIRLRIVGGNPGIHAVYIGGRPALWRISSDNLYVTLPPSQSGTVQIRAVFGDDRSASTNITISNAELDFTIVGDGAALGQTLLVSARQLAGSKVCRARLDGVDVALLDDSRDRSDCVPIRSGGRFNASILLADPSGEISGELIDKVIDLKDGDKLELEITDDAGVKATADVPIAVPRITFHPDRGVINRGESIVILGENFPPETPDYYNPPQVRLTVNGRRVGSVYPSSDGRWRYEYDRTNSLESGQHIRLDVYIDNYRLREITSDLDIRVASVGLAVNPSTVRINTPVSVTVTGLDRYAAGYQVRIRNGPFFTFNGATTFNSDRDGAFTGRATFPAFEPYSPGDGETFIFLDLYQGQTRVTGVYSTVTMLPGLHPTPTPIPTQTPLPTPTPTPVPTATPTPTSTPVPTSTPTPSPTPTPTQTPTPTPTPTLVPTDTPVPPPTFDRDAIVSAVMAAIATPTPDPTSGGSVDRPGGFIDADSTLLLILLVAVSVIALAAVIAAVLLLVARRRAAQQETPEAEEADPDNAATE